MPILTQCRRLDSLRYDGIVRINLGICWHSTPITAVLRSKELMVTIYLKAVAVGTAPNFLQGQEVRSILMEKLLDFVKAIGESVDIPTDKKHDADNLFFQEKTVGCQIFVISCGHVGIEGG